MRGNITSGSSVLHLSEGAGSVMSPEDGGGRGVGGDDPPPTPSFCGEVVVQCGCKYSSLSRGNKHSRTNMAS